MTKTTNKEMFVQLFKDTIVTLIIVTAVVVISAGIAHYFYKVAFAASGASLVFAVLGTTLAFVGNMFSYDALSRWGSVGLPQWRWGNKLQMVGFAFVIVALLIK